MEAGGQACWSCGKPVDVSDHYCRHCGMGLGQRLAWYYEKLWIAVLAVFALGPFVIPMIQRSPRFSPNERLVWNALALALGAYYVYVCYRAIQSLSSSMSGMLPMVPM